MRGSGTLVPKSCSCYDTDFYFYFFSHRVLTAAMRFVFSRVTFRIFPGAIPKQVEGLSELKAVYVRSDNSNFGEKGLIELVLSWF